MKTFERNGVSIRYRILGEGQPVVFLHGFPDTSEIWAGQAAAFEAAGYQAIVPDLRGFGQSSKPEGTSAYKLKEAAADVVGLLDSLKIERFFLVGHDWGAALSWTLAGAIPGRIRALAVLSTGHALGFFPAGGNAQRQRTWYCLFFLQPWAEGALRADDWALWRKLMEAEKPEVVRAQIGRMSEDGALAAGLEWYRANLTPEWFSLTEFPDVPKLKMPVLGLWSDGDAFLGEEQMKASSRFVEEGMFSYRRIQGASHWMQLDAGEELNRALLDFIKSAGERSAL